MDFGIPAGEIALLIAALLVAGVAAGFLAGLLGIGGGGVLVPVLYEVFRVLDVDPAIRMHLVLGTTLAIILPTSLKSFAGHRARGSVDMPLLKRVAAFIVAGVVLGTIAAKYASGDALKWVWVTAATLIAIKMAFGREDWRLADHLPPFPWPQLGALAIGFISTLMSIGGATFVVPLLTLYGKPILTAVATASGIGPLIALPGVIGFACGGVGRGRAAAVVDRLRQPARIAHRRTAQRVGGTLRRAPGAQDSAPHAGAVLCRVPGQRRAPLPDRPAALSAGRQATIF